MEANVVTKKWAWVAQVLACVALVLGMVDVARHLIQMRVWEVFPSLGVVFLAGAVSTGLAYMQSTERAN
jgi:hypothetical protein